MPKGGKLDRCVSKVRSKGGVKNPYAVCHASLKRGKRGKKK